ncbi:hypothetical protein GCM10022206_91890 [Streptomyces chiangmaiensis]
MDIGQTTERAISEWLARAHPVPERARTEWATQGVALLPLGARFCAVRMKADVVHAAVATEDPSQVSAALGELLRGPVIHDRRTVGGTYYALIQWHAGLVWAHQELAPCFGQDTYLGVPRVDRRDPPGAHWVVAPRYEGNLCVPRAVTALIEVGRRRLAEDSEA